MKERMKGGRKNLKRASADEHNLKLQDGQSMMQVMSLRGSNLIEVMHLFRCYIEFGSFVIVDESGKAIESGSKVTCIVSQVLFHDQVRKLQKSPEWPEIFKAVTLDDTSKSTAPNEEADELNSSEDEDDDGLPPLVANKNRIQPPFSEVDSESDTGSDSDS
ncbi:Probable RNA-binding protein EIF1AD [Linum perenne]